jgi:hypothetical protein
LQYEQSFGTNHRFSTGGEFTYYMVNWSGPKIESFVRVYGKDNGAEEGFFGQLKLGYGNLASLDLFDGSTNKRWSTVGGGIAGGYKFLIGEHFIIEQVFGFQVYTPPYQVKSTNSSSDPYSDPFDDYEDGLETAVEGIGWYLTSGFPIDFQLKLGWQF